MFTLSELRNYVEQHNLTFVNMVQVYNGLHIINHSYSSFLFLGEMSLS